MHIVPLRVGDERDAVALCQACAGARRVRAGDPRALGAGGQRAAATHCDGHPQPHRAAPRRAGAARGGARAGVGPASIGAPVVGSASDEVEVEIEEVSIKPSRAPSTSSAPAPSRARRSSAVRGLFVTGTGTGVGKTVLSAALLAAIAAAGEQVSAHKPVVTGVDDPPGRVAARPRAAGARRRDDARGGRAAALRARGVAPSRGRAGGRARLTPSGSRRQPRTRCAAPTRGARR